MTRLTPTTIARAIPCAVGTVRAWLRTGKVRPRWRARVLQVVGDHPAPIAHQLRAACGEPAPEPMPRVRRLSASDVATACGVSPAAVTRWLDTRAIPPQYRRAARTITDSGRPVTRQVAELGGILRAYEIADTIAALREHATRIPAHAEAVLRAVEALQGVAP